MSCLPALSVTVDLMDCKRNPTCNKIEQIKSNLEDLINTLSSAIDHSAKSLKKMKVSTISTQFSSRLELLDGKILRNCFLVVLGLDLVVGLAPDNLPNFCTSDCSMRLLHDNQVELPSVHCFLNC